MIRIISAVISVLIGLVCRAADPLDEPGAGPSSIDRYVRLMQGNDISRRSGDEEAFLRQWWEAHFTAPGRARRAMGMVVNDEGQQLDAVEVEAGWYRGSEDEPKLVKTRMVNGSFDIGLDGYDRVTLRFRKAGYREVFFGAGGEHRFTVERAREMWSRICHMGGAHPRWDGGAGVFVIMHPQQYEWSPKGPSPSLPPRRANWPAAIDASALPLVSSEDVDDAVAPETGTYVVADARGKVVLLERLWRGMSLGFDGTDRQWQRVRFGTSGNTLPIEAGPYRWYLYSVAKPIYPATQPAVRESIQAQEKRR